MDLRGVQQRRRDRWRASEAAPTELARLTGLDGGAGWAFLHVVAGAAAAAAEVVAGAATAAAAAVAAAAAAEAATGHDG